MLDFFPLSHDDCRVLGNHLLAFLVITGLCLREVQSEPVPRALPVDPEKITPVDDPAPKAQPAKPAEKEGSADADKDPDSSIPKALPVSPEDPDRTGVEQPDPVPGEAGQEEQPAEEKKRS